MMKTKEDIARQEAIDVLIQRHYREYASIYKYKLSRVKDSQFHGRSSK